MTTTIFSAFNKASFDPALFKQEFKTFAATQSPATAVFDTRVDNLDFDLMCTEIEEWGVDMALSPTLSFSPFQRLDPYKAMAYLEGFAGW